MKYFLLIAGVLFAVTLRIGAADASIVLLDYGNDGPAPTLGGTWNTFASLSGGGLLDTGGNNTGLNISFGSGIETLGGDQGAWSFGDKDWVDGDATRDGFSTRSGTADTTVTISGFQVGSVWRFDHVSVRDRSASSRVADYTVNG